MPPKSKITREMIIVAALEILRTTGVAGISARSVAKYLNCSTQPVMYHFAKIEELKQQIYSISDSYHRSYITKVKGDYNDIVCQVGLLYVRFAFEERHIFQFLFHNSEFNFQSRMLDSNELSPILFILQRSSGISLEQARDIFATVFIAAHGIACLVACGAMEFDEAAIAARLRNVYLGAVHVIKHKTAL